MAKSKSFFGLRRGSTKSLTFSVLNGQQVTKDRVYGGKNPRSLAQMNQRLCMATASAAYADMKQIVDHSFEGVSYGANSMAKFLSLNVKQLKANIGAANPKFGYNPYGDRNIRCGAYIMSAGTASNPAATITDTVNSTTHKPELQLISSKYDGGTQVFTANAIMETYGLQVGDMLTHVAIIPERNKTTNKFMFVRFKFVKAGDVTLTSENLSEYIEVEIKDNLGTVAIDSDSVSAIKVTINVATEDDFFHNSGVIHSRLVNGVWTRNNVTLATAVSEDYIDLYDDAIATYPVGESYVLNGGEIE